MGVKSGLDPRREIDVINSGSGLNTASATSFRAAILRAASISASPTGLMVKDVRLYLDEMKSLG